MKKDNIYMTHGKSFVTDLLFFTYISLVSFKLIYQKLFLQLRYLEFEWKELLFAAGAGLLIALIFYLIKGFSIGKRITGLDKTYQKNKFYADPVKITGIIIFIITCYVGFYITEFSLREFFSQKGLESAKNIFTAILTPETSIAEETIFAAIQTIFMAFMATLIAIPFAFLTSFVAAKNLMTQNWGLKILYYVVRFFMNFTRSVEPLIWAIIFSVWVGIGPFAGMLALLIHSISALSKLYSEQIESINDGPLEAIKATGASPLLVIWYGVVPQIVLPYLSFTIYRWDINVRMATVIGLVGGGGLGTGLMQYIGIGKWHEVGFFVLIIVIIVWMMDYASARIRERIK